jgi:hypothetical protein
MIKFNSPVSLTVRPARTVQVKARTIKVSSIDPTQARWMVDPTAKTVKVYYPGWPPLVVMGSSAKTAYQDGCTQAQVQAALLLEVGAPALASGPGTAAG